MWYFYSNKSRFLEFFRRSWFHLLCLLLKSFPGSLSKHFHFLSSADSRNCPVRGIRDCIRVYFFDFEPRSSLQLLRRFMFHLFYHYLAIPNQELLPCQCFSSIELCETNARQNLLCIYEVYYVSMVYFMYLLSVLCIYGSFYVSVVWSIYLWFILCICCLYYVSMVHFMYLLSVLCIYGSFCVSFVCTIYLWFILCICCLYYVSMVHFMYQLSVLCIYGSFYVSVVCTMYLCLILCICCLYYWRRTVCTIDAGL